MIRLILAGSFLFFTVQVVVAQLDPTEAAELADAGTAPEPGEPRAVPGQFVVRFKTGTARVQRQSAATDLGAGIRFFERHPAARARRQGEPSVFDDLAVVTLPPGQSAAAAMKRMQRRDDVIVVEPNGYYYLAVSDGDALPGSVSTVHPSDFQFPDQWALMNTGKNGGTVGADIGAVRAWALNVGSRETVVAIVDTGIDYLHPDLAPNMWRHPGEIPNNGVDDDGNGYIDDLHGFDFVSSDAYPVDDNRHGTHVAGTVGAVGNNEIGVSGVCWEVSLMALKAFDERGRSDLVALIDALRYAVDNGAHIVNASWGSPDESKVLEEIIGELAESNVLFVAAAGNNGSDRPFYPAAYKDVINVAATDRLDKRARFSNHGPTVDVSAPGSQILSTTLNNTYGILSGTSMAAPHVSGVAALVRSAHPEFSAAEIENILRNTGDERVSDKPIGTGRVNAFRALEVDVPLPVAELDLPPVLFGRMTLKGTATGRDFAGYSLSYGAGANPDVWTDLHFSGAPVENGPLLRDFYTPLLEEGEFTIRLTVLSRTGLKAEDRARVKIRNVYLTSPLDNDAWRKGDVVPIDGRVFGWNRTYRVEYGVGKAPEQWSDEGMILVPPDREEADVVDPERTLAFWDTSRLAGNQFYTLRLSAESPWRPERESFVYMVYIDSNLKPGWPVRVPIEGDLPAEAWREVIVADMNGDGFQELLVIDPGNADGKPTALLVYRHDGRLAWSRDIGSGAPYVDRPAVGDVDGDGFLEVFAGAGDTSEIHGFHWDGQPMDGWPVRTDPRGFGKVVADVDGDGIQELVALSRDPLSYAADRRQLIVVGRDGRILHEWDVAFCDSDDETPIQLPAVGNLDDDPALEIVVVWNCSSLAMFDIAGPHGPRWTASAEGKLLASPVLVDLDRNGRQEIVIGAAIDEENGMHQGGLHVFDQSGALWPRWPVLVDASFPGAPAIADMDQDGDLEVCVIDWEENQIHIVQHNGFPLRGWPIRLNGAASARTSPIIGDVDGDHLPDVILPNPGNLFAALKFDQLTGVGGVRAFRRDGSEIGLSGRADFKGLYIEAAMGTDWFKAPPATITDMDGDGRLDLVGVSIQDLANLRDDPPIAFKNRSSIYVWGLPIPYIAVDHPWPAFQGSARGLGEFHELEEPNQPPMFSAVPDQIVAPGNSFESFDLASYLVDPDHPLEQLRIDVGGAGLDALTVTVSENYVVEVRPVSAEWTGVGTVELTAVDPDGAMGGVSVRFEVRSGYRAPVANPDRVEMDEDGQIAIAPLVNDVSDAGEELFLAGFSQSANGRVSADSETTLLYRPRRDFHGTDSFQYQVRDFSGGTSLGTVQVRILPVSDPPTAVADHLIVLEDASGFVDVLANDSDPDGDVIEVIDLGEAVSGTVGFAGDGTIEYRPDRDFAGEDAFQYTVRDANGETGIGEVNVRIKPVNDAPTAMDQSFSLNKNLSRNVTFKGADVDGDKLTYTVVDGPAHGALFNFPAVATYYPEKGFTGTDSFTYVAEDGQEVSLPATVLFTVEDVNNPPLAPETELVVRTNRPRHFELEVRDPEDDPLTFEILVQPEHGRLSGSGPSFTYTPVTDYVGEDRFTYRAWDIQSPSESRDVAITVTDENTAPAAQALKLTVALNKSLKLPFAAVDQEGDPVVFEIVDGPAHGRLAGRAPNVWYIPDRDFSGTERLRYRASDGELTGDTAEIVIAVRFPNDEPLAKDQRFIVEPNTVLTGELDVSDGDGDALVCPVFKGVRHGVVTVRGTTFTYRPDADFRGTDRFTYKPWDGLTYGNRAQVTLVVSGQAPETALRFESVQFLSDGRVELRIETPQRKPFTIEVSANLDEWEALSSHVPNDIITTVIEPRVEAESRGRRFYRAIEADDR